MAYKKKEIPERAKRVKKELIDRGMAQRDLARELGINENYLTAILNGRKEGSKYWPEIEQALGLTESHEAI